MHVVVSWDITASKPRWDEINDSMREALKPYSWVRPLTTFYVVQLSGEWQRNSLRDELITRAKAVAETVFFVISPVMASGQQYDGYLPVETWDKVNERTR